MFIFDNSLAIAFIQSTKTNAWKVAEKLFGKYSGSRFIFTRNSDIVLSDGVSV
jgi:hypothetical protein